MIPLPLACETHQLADKDGTLVLGELIDLLLLLGPFVADGRGRLGAAALRRAVAATAALGPTTRTRPVG